MLFKKLGLVLFAGVLSLGVLVGCAGEDTNEDMENDQEEQDMEDGN
jgi:hypothetical protein